jgi:hypothetical protein
MKQPLPSSAPVIPGIIIPTGSISNLLVCLVITARNRNGGLLPNKLPPTHPHTDPGTCRLEHKGSMQKRFYLKIFSKDSLLSS